MAANPAFVNVSTIATGTTSVASTYPASIVAGNLLVASIFIDCGNAKSITSYGSVPSGWTLIITGATGGQYGGAAYYKVATGSESGTVTIGATISGSGSGTFVGQIAQYSGNATTGTIAHKGVVKTATSASASYTLIGTTTVLNELAVCIIGAGASITVAGITGATGGTWVENAAEQHSGATSLDWQSSNMGAVGSNNSGGTSALGSSTGWHTVAFLIAPPIPSVVSVDLNPVTFSYALSTLTPRVMRDAVLNPVSFAYSPGALTPRALHKAALSPVTFVYSPANLNFALIQSVKYAVQLSPVSFTYALGTITPSIKRAAVLSPVSFTYGVGSLIPKVLRKTVLSPVTFSYGLTSLVVRTTRKAALSPVSFTYALSTLTARSKRPVVLGPVAFSYSLAPLTASVLTPTILHVTLSPVSFSYTVALGQLWNLTGSYVLDTEYVGAHYVTPLSLIQDSNGNLTGSGGSAPYTWTINSGHITGNTFEFWSTYDSLVINQHHIGTIAADGTISGNWDDDYTGGRAGTFTTTSGAAARVTSGPLTPRVLRKAPLTPVSFLYTPGLLSPALSIPVAYHIALSPISFTYALKPLTANVVVPSVTYHVALSPVSFLYTPGPLSPVVISGGVTPPTGGVGGDYGPGKVYRKRKKLVFPYVEEVVQTPKKRKVSPILPPEVVEALKKEEEYPKHNVTTPRYDSKEPLEELHRLEAAYAVLRREGLAAEASARSILFTEAKRLFAEEQNTEEELVLATLLRVFYTSDS